MKLNKKGDGGGTSGFRTLIGVLIMIAILALLVYFTYQWISGNVSLGGIIFG